MVQDSLVKDISLVLERLSIVSDGHKPDEADNGLSAVSDLKPRLKYLS